MKIFFFVCLTLFALSLADDCGTLIKTEAPKEYIPTATANVQNKDDDTPTNVGEWAADKLKKEMAKGTDKMDGMMEKLQKEVKEILDKTPKMTETIKSMAMEAVKKITGTVVPAVKEAEKMMHGAIEEGKNKIDESMKDSKANFEKMQECMDKEGKGSMMPEDPMGEIRKCVTNRMEEAEEIIRKFSAVMEKMAQIVIETPTQISEILEGLKSWTSVWQVPLKIGTMGAKKLAQAVSVGSEIASTATSCMKMLLSTVGEVTKCMDNEVNDIVQNVTKQGISIIDCMNAS